MYKLYTDIILMGTCLVHFYKEYCQVAYFHNGSAQQQIKWFCCESLLPCPSPITVCFGGLVRMSDHYHWECTPRVLRSPSIILSFAEGQFVHIIWQPGIFSIELHYFIFLIRVTYYCTEKNVATSTPCHQNGPPIWISAPSTIWCN